MWENFPCQVFYDMDKGIREWEQFPRFGVGLRIFVRPGEPHPALMQALHRLLRPLVRVLIAKDITFPSLSRMLKEIYVEVAREQFTENDKPLSDSRISLLTGVHRKDIKALREGRNKPGAAPSVLSRNAHLIALWTGAPDYLDGRGRPLALPRQRPKKGGVSFESLVESVSTDIRPRAVLDEWLRRGLARLGDDDRVHLNTRAFVPTEEFADIAYYFGRNLRDHIAASSHNLLGGDPAMLEQAVYYEELTPQSVEELQRLSREVGSSMLVKINQRAFELAERDKGKGDASQRITFGVYFFAASDDDDRADGEA